MRRWWSFGPYVLIGLIHLATLAVGSDALSSGTKVLLMPALFVALLVSLPTPRSRIALWAGTGILFSWIGDVLLSAPGERGFVAGLGAFALAHVAYLLLFLGPLRTRRVPRLTLLLLLWWAALVLVLGPHLSLLLLPVALYGAVLGSSTAASFGTSRLVALGGLFFLASDSVLAFKMFMPGFVFWQEDFAVMLAYIAGQGLIAAGAVAQARLAVRAVPLTV